MTLNTRPVAQVNERHRSFTWLDDLRRDMFHAARLLRRNPLMTMTAALSLAVGIGANTAIFTLANALLLRPPVGVADPDRLVDIGVGRIGSGFNPGSYPMYLDIRQRSTTLDGVYAHPMFPQAMSLRTAGSSAAAERIFGHSVTTNYFTVLGTVPFAGRLFGTDSDRPSSSPVAVLSYRFWTRRFNKDPDVVGQLIQLNGQAFAVIGVAPEGFQGTGIVAADVWVPLIASGSAQESIFTSRSGGWLVMGGRLKPGIPLARAAAELEAIGVALDREYPTTPAAIHTLRLLPSSQVPGNTTIVGGFVALLMTIVTIVLIVACANIAGMLLARASARRREIAVRLAIGAGRGRLIRQLLTETAMLFALGGIGGLALARALTWLIVPLLPSLPMPVSVSLSLDGRVIAFTIGLSLIAAVLSGLAPALQASKADLVAALKDDEPAASGRSRVRHSFVIAQVAFSLLLVVVAGLFVRSLQQAGSMHPGFDAQGVELASLDLSMAGYTDTTGPRFARDLLDRVRRLPAVQAATIARTLPGGFEGIGLGGVTAPGGALPADPLFVPAWNIVEPGYFATLRIPLIAGRDFSAADLAGAPPVTIVGEGVARRFWPGQSAVGQYLAKQVYGPDGRPKGMRMLLVVGVARDVKSSSLIDGQAESYVYVPLQQEYTSRMTANMTIAARTARDQRITDEIRAVVASMNPTLPIVRSETLEEAAALGLTPQRVVASIAGSLGVIAGLLAAIGIYGVTAYAVARRTREFGIRLAVGAQPADIVGMVLRQGMRLAVIGAAIGLALSAAASRVLVVVLFGVSPMDPVIFGGAAALFIAIGLAACYGPARRATRVDPLVALRYE
jgi:predicted permease